MLDVVAGRSFCDRIATPPPTPAETTAIAKAPAVKAPARERFWGRDRGWALRGLRCPAVRIVGCAELLRLL